MPSTEQYVTRLIEWVNTQDFRDAADEFETLTSNGVAMREAFDMIVDIYKNEDCTL